MNSCLSEVAFIDAANRNLSEGYCFANPGGGTSRIERITRTAITYRRGKSPITVRWSGLYRAYSHFKGKRVSSTDLRKFAPAVFDSNARPAGHSCNCTFFFHLIEKMGLAEGGLRGRGVNGDPFALMLKDTT